MEREVLGTYLSSHPVEPHATTLRKEGATAIGDLSELPDRTAVTIGGLVTNIRRTRTKKGHSMAFVTVEDLSGAIEAVVFPRAYDQANSNLRVGGIITMHGTVEIHEQQATFLCQKVRFVQ